MREEKIYITADELAKYLGISKGYAYKLMHEMNEELKNKGYLTITGKLPIKYFKEKYYGA